MPPPDWKRKLRLDQNCFIVSPDVEKLVQIEEDMREVRERVRCKKPGCNLGFFGPWRARDRDAIGQIDLLRRIVRRRLLHSIREQFRLMKHELIVKQSQGLGRNRRDVAAAAG